ncbi:hypothetical protein BUE80_DR001645 [Diplocarpon rosae]|nr:hypothetical protein BUE80_DR001645 [Diplocarpon rosae]
MGNSSTKEARSVDSSPPNVLRQANSGGASGTSADRSARVDSSRSNRGSRPDLSFLGIGSSSQNEVPERRETKQEREARKLEKERVARIKERERSLKEEHIDGGFLVTMGVYTGPEDFNKVIVRQLMIERRMAPFWRGLDDFKEEWAEHQLVAAGRGLPIPPADEIPPEDLTRPLSSESSDPSKRNLHNLMPPISSRSQSAASDASATLSLSHPVFANASSSSAAALPAPAHPSSPFRPRSKTSVSITNTSKTKPSSEIVPREIQLQRDPYVNGQAIEVYLYKDATECPICFMFYPPYLNKTRCCDQPICSECFVQIKRPDPHPPEHHDPSNPATPPTEADVDPEALVSEPACCPYCQQPEFGVTYEAPAFRRGLSYANANPNFGNFSSTGVNPALLSVAQKRRTTSISANAPTVITTDKVRPDWSIKLQNARNHLARRSAAATALHTAAYLIGSGNTDQRSFGFSGRNRFGRNNRNENSPGASGTATPSPTTNESAPRNLSDQLNLLRHEPSESGGIRSRRRMEDLEEMMMMEAIRQSLAAEEERKKKAEKETAKEAKKKAKEDKKREKRESKRVYGSGASSTSGSALSLSLPNLGVGRRRGNSGASMLQREVTFENHETLEPKGKGVDRSTPKTTGGSAPIDFPRPATSSGYGIIGARHLDTSTLAAINDAHQHPASPTAPDISSNLRQTSNASSPASSFAESNPGSIRNERNTHDSSSTIDSPGASGISLAAHHGNSDGGDAGTESLFNFQSLATMISADSKEDKEDAAKHIEYLVGEGSKQNIPEESRWTKTEESVATLKDDCPTTTANNIVETPDLEQRSTPEVTITPETPAAINHDDDDGKQLGANWSSATREITQ